jgi:hypothetical protein
MTIFPLVVIQGLFWPSRLREWAVELLRRVPFREVWLSVAVLLLIGEHYPFSNFPMYSGLGNTATYHVVETFSGERLPFATTFTFRASHASKAWNTERRKFRKDGLDEAEARRAAAEKLLEFLLARVPPERSAGLRVGGVRFVEVTVSIDGRKLVKQRAVLGEVGGQ